MPATTGYDCFFRHQDNFATATAFAIRPGGDTDTIASMTGAISRGDRGVGAISVSGQSRREDADVLKDWAMRLMCSRMVVFF